MAQEYAIFNPKVISKPDTPAPQAAKEAQKQPWEMTALEYTQSRVKGATTASKNMQMQHKVEIEAAIKRGDTVPPEVLAEYPELKGDDKETVIDRAAGGNPGWTATYTQGDFGTEREVVVKDADGKIIGQRDPFWPGGIPTDKRERESRLRAVAREIVQDYEKKATADLPDYLGSDPEQRLASIKKKLVDIGVNDLSDSEIERAFAKTTSPTRLTDLAKRLRDDPAGWLKDEEIQSRIAAKVNRMLQRDDDITPDSSLSSSKPAAGKPAAVGEDKPAAKPGSKFYINKGEEGFVEVKGASVKLPGYEKYDTFIHKEVDGWRVSEGRTGSRLGGGKTQTAAKRNAVERLDRATEQGVKLDDLIAQNAEKGQSPRYEGGAEPEAVAPAAKKPLTQKVKEKPATDTAGKIKKAVEKATQRSIKTVMDNERDRARFEAMPKAEQEQMVERRRQEYRTVADKVVQQIEDKDVKLVAYLHKGNRMSREVFEAVTGIKLPNTEKGSREVLREFIGAEKVAAWEAEKEAAKPKKPVPMTKEQAKEKMMQARADKYLEGKVRYDGQVMTRGEYIEKLYAEGRKPSTRVVDIEPSKALVKEYRDARMRRGFNQSHPDYERFRKAEDRLKAGSKKTEYRLFWKDDDTRFSVVTKTEFDYFNKLAAADAAKPTAEAAEDKPTRDIAPQDKSLQENNSTVSKGGYEYRILKSSDLWWKIEQTSPTGEKNTWNVGGYKDINSNSEQNTEKNRQRAIDFALEKLNLYDDYAERDFGKKSIGEGVFDTIKFAEELKKDGISYLSDGSFYEIKDTREGWMVSRNGGESVSDRKIAANSGNAPGNKEKAIEHAISMAKSSFDPTAEADKGLDTVTPDVVQSEQKGKTDEPERDIARLDSTPERLRQDEIAAHGEPPAGTPEVPAGTERTERPRLGGTEGGDRLPGAEHRPGREPAGDRRSDTGAVDKSARRGESRARRPDTGRIDFSITDTGFIKQTGQKSRYRQNVDAIRLLKKIESENRLATAEEQSILVQYVGWGGIPQAFDEKNAKWSSEHAELKELLTDEEYKAARASTMNAHYTSPEIITGMWQGLEAMGFKGGRINEPSMGVGHFYGLIPDRIAGQSKLHGVELDSLTGRIAQQLYQSVSIQVKGFEKVKYPDGFFDLFISNVPFGDYNLSDPDMKGVRFRIHDFFFAKALKKTRPGGLVAFITSKGTLDKKDGFVRQYLAKEADLVAAIRLPYTAFKGNAATEVVTDILVFQKRDPAKAPGGETFTEIVNVQNDKGETFAVNEYFQAHPDHILGTLSYTGSMYGPDQMNVEPVVGMELGQKVTEILSSATLPESLDAQQDARTAEMSSPDYQQLSPDHVKEGAYVIQDGKLFQNTHGELVGIEAGQSKIDRYKSMISVRDTARDLILKQITPDTPSADVEKARKLLNATYDRFVRQYKPFSGVYNVSQFREDPDYPLLMSLEHYDKETKKATKADIFRHRTQFPVKVISRADTIDDAIAASMAQKGHLDIEYVATLMGATVDDTVARLGGMAFENPETGAWEPSAYYLSGNVRHKLKAAISAAEQDSRYKDNVDALEKVQPEDISPADIDIRIGVPWVSPDVYRQFLNDITDGASSNVRFTKLSYDGSWKISGQSSHPNWSTRRMSTSELVSLAMNQKEPTIKDKDRDGNPFVNQEETVAARVMQANIKDEFSRWVWSDADRADQLARIYNDEYNNIVFPEWDGSYLKLPGKIDDSIIKLRPHQLNVVSRFLVRGNLLMAHSVGAGKTFAGVAMAMEARRIGQAKKPVFVVPNHKVDDWRVDFMTLYPSAKVLAASRKDFQPKNRQALANRIATGDWDAVIVPMSSFGKIPMSPERMKNFFASQIEELERVIEELSEEEGKKSASVKQVEASKKRLEEKLSYLSAEGKKDKGPYFDELGIDMLFVDEAHNYKNLFFPTKMGRVAGIPNNDTQAAFDMYVKSQYVNETTNNRGLVFATGTPVANSVAEMYTMQRYLDPGTLKERDIEAFDFWAKIFGDTVTDVEVDPAGGGYRVHTRFARFTNVPELLQIYRMFTDIQTHEMMKLPLPAIKGGKPEIVSSPSSPELKAYVDTLLERAEAIRSGQVDKREDNMLSVTNDGRHAALDIRLRDSNAKDRPDSKINLCVNRVYDIWKQYASTKGTQVIWSDLSTPTGHGHSLYHDIKEKLTAKGIPAGEIVFAQDASTEAQTATLHDKINKGKIRVVIASTKKMGEGANVQKRLVAAHHLTPPWRPADMEQRDGRILRFGNMYEKDGVHIVRYVTKGSFDAYMWQTLETKAKFIAQIMSGETTAREMEDLGGQAFSYAEVKAVASDNPKILEAVKLDADVKQLQMLERAYKSDMIANQRQVKVELPAAIKSGEHYVSQAQKDWAEASKAIEKAGDNMDVVVDKKAYKERKAAVSAITKRLSGLNKLSQQGHLLAEVYGMPIEVSWHKQFVRMTDRDGMALPDKETGFWNAVLMGKNIYTFQLGDDPSGNLTRILNQIKEIPSIIQGQQALLARKKKTMEQLEDKIKQPFDKDGELSEKRDRLQRLYQEIGLEKKHKTDHNIIDEDTDTVPADTKQIDSKDAFYVHTDKGFERVDGKDIDLSERLEGLDEFDFFVHKKDPSQSKFKWHISEAKTGLAIGYGDTQEAAAIESVTRIEKLGVETLQATVEKKIEENGMSPRYRDDDDTIPRSKHRGMVTLPGGGPDKASTKQKALAHILAKQKGLLDDKGKPTEAYKELLSSLTGKQSMADITPDQASQFINALQGATKKADKQAAVEQAPEVVTERPEKRKGDKVITVKTERKIQSLRENLTKAGIMDDAAYGAILNRVTRGRAPRYIDDDTYITEKQGKEIVKRMLNAAEKLRSVLPYQQSIDQNPEIKAQVDKLIARQAEKKQRLPHSFESMRYFAQKYGNRTGTPMYEMYLDTVNAHQKMAQSRYLQLEQAYGHVKPGVFRKISNDRAACARIEDYLDTNGLQTDGMSSDEINVAKGIQSLLADYAPKARAAKFMNWYATGQGLADYDDFEAEILQAVEIYESQGRDALYEHLKTQEFGTIHTGYSPKDALVGRVNLYSTGPATLGKSHVQVRTDIEYHSNERTIFQKLPAYMRQIDMLYELQPKIGAMVQVLDDTLGMLPEGKARIIKQDFELFFKHLKRYNSEGGFFERMVTRLYSQAVRARILVEPALALRNNIQPIALIADKTTLIDPRNKKLSAEDMDYLRTHGYQTDAIRSHYFLENEAGLWGLRTINKLVDRFTLYPISDQLNRLETFWAKINQVRRALDDTTTIKDMMAAAKFDDMTINEQRQALAILAKDGPDAMARFVARVVTDDIQFRYDRAERSPAEQSPYGKVFGNLILFRRAYFERKLKALNKVMAMKGGTARERSRGLKMILSMIFGGLLAGALYQKVTGRRQNPYDPRYIFSPEIGGLQSGMIETVNEVSSDLYGAIFMGDKAAMGRLTISIPRTSSMFIPYYDMVLRTAEAATDQRYLDRKALRSIRELIDESYKLNGGYYEVERDAFHKWKHFIGGRGADTTAKEQEAEAKKARKSDPRPSRPSRPSRPPRPSRPSRP